MNETVPNRFVILYAIYLIVFMDFSINSNHSSLISRVTLCSSPNPLQIPPINVLCSNLLRLSLNFRQNWEIPVNKMDLRGVEYEKIPDWTLIINIISETRQNQDNYKQVKHITKEFFKIKANASFFFPDIKTVFFILDGVNFAKIFWRESHRFLHAWNLDGLSLHWMMCYHHSPCLLLQHSVWKSPKKSHFIILWAKRRAMLTTKIPLWTILKKKNG